MIRSPLTSLLAAVVITSAGCSTTPPPRPAYTGPDTVAAIDRSDLVGRWQGRVLNPIEGESTGPFDVEFAADDTVSYTMPDTSSGLGLVYEMTGTWQVVDETVSTQLTDIQETSGSALGALAARLASSFRDRIAGSADVYEASANRIVLVSDEGQAQELIRAR